MKKILSIMLVAAALPISGFAGGTSNDYYVGAKLHKNANMMVKVSMNRGFSEDIKKDPFGFSVNLGRKAGEFGRIEAEIGYGGGIRVEGPGETDSYGAGSAMFNGYLEKEIMKGFAPYIGAGIGIGWISTEIDAYGYGFKLSKTQGTLSYQFMLGANISVSDSVDLNIGVKYQDYGQLEMQYGPTKILVDVWATELYTGVAYKF